MLLVHKLEEIIDPWIGDKIQNECKPFVVLYSFFLKTNTWKMYGKWLKNHLTNENSLYKKLMLLIREIFEGNGVKVVRTCQKLEPQMVSQQWILFSPKLEPLQRMRKRMI